MNNNTKSTHELKFNKSNESKLTDVSYECPTKTLESGKTLVLKKGDFLFETDPISKVTKEFKGYNEYGEQQWITVVRDKG